MSLKKIAFVICAYCLSVISVQGQDLETFIKDYDKTEMYQIKKNHQQSWENVPQDQQRGWKQYKRWEYFWSQRLFPDATYKKAMNVYSDVQQQIKNKHFESTQSNNWKLIGPISNPEPYAINSKGMGRVNVARFHPTDPNTIWIGTASGGVWKTHNKGQTWESFPFTQFLSLGVSDIAISPTDPNTIYVATGDADGSLGTANFFSSIGIIKTTDGGETWNVTGMSSELSEYNVISRLIIHPNNPDELIAATSRGIFKTTDGGDTWKNTRQGNFRDLEIKFNDPNFVYAATGSVRERSNKIFITKDFGETWELKHTELMAGRIQMAVSKLDPDMMVAICSQYLHSGLASIIATYNSGETFETLIDSTYGNLLNWGYDLETNQRGQSYYDLCIAIANNNSSKIIIGGIECHRTLNGGYKWEKCTNTNVNNSIHVDMHDLVYNPLNNELYLCNDGGIYYSKDDGASWTDLSRGLSITQYYRFGMSATNPNLIVCGAQDNGTSMFIDGKWYMTYGGDGMDCAIDPNDDNKIYYSIYNGKFYKSNTKGKTYQILLNSDVLQSVYGVNETGAWIAPFALNPQNSGSMYACYNNVWKSSNYGRTWTVISKYNSAPITAFAVAPNDSNYLYVVIRNILYMSSNGGSQWKMVTSETNTITSISVSPNDPNRIWYSLSGYNADRKVIMYDGTNFTNLSGNIPNVPINTIVYQNNTNDRLYIGTDIGVFYSESQSNIWDNYNSNLPNLIISELEIFYGSTVPKLRAATYGRGLWETDVVVCDNEVLNISPNEEINICPNEYVEFIADGEYSNYVWSNGETGKTLKTNTPGIYSASAYNGDCKVRSKAVEVKIIPTANIKAAISGNAPACIGDTLTLIASAGFSEYLWSNGETERSIKVSQSGNYSVKGKKTNEICESFSDTLYLEFVPKPNKPTITKHGSRLVAQEDTTLTYQWYIGNTLIKGAKSRIYEPDSSGTYRLLVTNQNGCSTFSDEIYTEYSSVIEYKGLNSISISPNPSNGEFRLEIHCSVNDLIEYTITNSIGQTILSKEFKSSTELFESVVDLGNHSDGIYMIMIKINGNSSTVKLIKK